MSRPMQVTVGFVDGVPVMDLARVLEARYNADVTVGQGQTTNGIPINTIIVSPKKQEAS